MRLVMSPEEWCFPKAGIVKPSQGVRNTIAESRWLYSVLSRYIRLVRTLCVYIYFDSAEDRMQRFQHPIISHPTLLTLPAYLNIFPPIRTRPSQSMQQQLGHCGTIENKIKSVHI